MATTRRVLLTLLVCTTVVLAGCTGWGTDGPTDTDGNQSPDESGELEEEQNNTDNDGNGGDQGSDGAESDGSGDDSNNGGGDSAESGSSASGSASDSDSSGTDSDATIESDSDTTSDSSSGSSNTDSDTNTDSDSNSDADSDSATGTGSDSDSSGTDNDTDSDGDGNTNDTSEESSTQVLRVSTLNSVGDVIVTDVTIENTETGDSETKPTDQGDSGGFTSFEVIPGEYVVSATIDNERVSETVTVRNENTGVGLRASPPEPETNSSGWTSMVTFS